MDENKIDVSHLVPSAQKAAMLPDKERLQHIRADHWIGYTRARAVLARLEELFAWPTKLRMPNLLIIGPTNNGKSMIIEKFRRSHPVQSHADFESIPVAVVQMPSEPSVARFYGMLLAAIGAPQRKSAKVAELEQMAISLLRSVQARIIVIDEMHNLLASKKDAHREFLNLLRFLGNELRIPIIGVGTKDAYLAIRLDAQLENRFEPEPLPVWEEGDELRSLLSSFSAAIPLRRPSEISSEEMSRYILSRTQGTIGEITKLLTTAAVLAIETGEESINKQTLELASYHSPDERRRMFERALK